MNSYEEKQEARRQRYLEAARKAKQESDQRWHKAHAAVANIPMGQPVLVGHHSEKRHRAALKRQDDNMRMASEANQRADHYASKAIGIDNAGISSDDPDAVIKLREELAKLEEKQGLMKAINAAHAKFVKDPNTLSSCGLSAEWQLIIREYAPSGTWDKHPILPYQLSNLSGNIRRVKKRIELLTAYAGIRPREDRIGPGFVLSEDVEDNRIIFKFDTRISKEHHKMMRSYGFVYSGTRKAYVRRLLGGRYSADAVFDKLTKEAQV